MASMNVHMYDHTSSLLSSGKEVVVVIEVEALCSNKSFTVCCANVNCNGILCLKTLKLNIKQKLEYYHYLRFVDEERLWSEVRGRIVRIKIRRRKRRRRRSRRIRKIRSRIRRREIR